MTFHTELKLGLEQASQSDILRGGYGRRVDHIPNTPATAFWPVLAKISGVSGAALDLVLDDGTVHTGVVKVGDPSASGSVVLFDRSNRRFYPVGGMMPVTLEADGGSQGDGSTTCSLTYAVTWNGITLASGVSPLFARIPNCKLMSGTHGIGHMSGTTFVLDCVDEVPETVTSKRIDCDTGQVSDGGLAAGGGSYT